MGNGVRSVGNRADVRDFLISRRARISPGRAGLPSGGRRRVPGLRREEVALLAGVSVDWYTRLEKGHIGEVSREVLDAVAGVLRLDEEERVYLFDLARAARPARRVAEVEEGLPESARWLLDGMTLSSAMITGRRQDVLAANALARALYAPLFASGATTGSGRANLARYHFLDPGARDFYGDWGGTADVLVAALRAEAGRDPRDVGIRELVGELTGASGEFRARWAAHDVLLHPRGAKVFRHPVAGTLSLSYHSVDLPVSATETRHVCACTAEPGSVDEERLLSLVGRAGGATRVGGGVEPEVDGR
ncbi:MULTISPECIES: helix-turn-helix transcriptional regulator [Actinosynnema]|uniref:helix-turn-helix transcriptional regulator n=1 Tax=Actinosynnema TaxID=40566 RepID=UPI0020A5D3A4|nr:helix-turn-helix transcriptional regulator [Actinosynnema pretiosum]MCP2097652.1 Helix-turn-helix domain-containing protein [Actinosynnema pretiosum]